MCQLLISSYIFPTDGGKAVLNPYDQNCNGQKWMIDGNKVQMKMNPKKVLDLTNTCGHGTELCVSDFKCHDCQVWYFDFE